MGCFVALLADFSAAKSTCPSLFLGEAGEKCGKSLQEHGYLPQLLLWGFWITSRVALLSLGAMPETRRSSHRKPALRAFLLQSESLRIILGRGGNCQAETLEIVLQMMKIIPLLSGRALHLLFGLFDLFQGWIRIIKTSVSLL